MVQMKHCEAMLPVVNLDRARNFYGGILALEERGEIGGDLLFETSDGKSHIALVPRGEPTRAEHTVASFEVDDLEAAVSELEGKGVQFEEYDEPDLKTENKIASMNGIRCAWFRDTEGNILCLHETGSGSPHAA